MIQTNKLALEFWKEIKIEIFLWKRLMNRLLRFIQTHKKNTKSFIFWFSIWMLGIYSIVYGLDLFQLFRIVSTKTVDTFNNFYSVCHFSLSFWQKRTKKERREKKPLNYRLHVERRSCRNRFASEVCAEYDSLVSSIEILEILFTIIVQ